jgi:DNA-binding NtrC family response regulator
MVSAGEFQPDFYSHLKAVSIDISPLRERRQDIPLLLDHYLHVIAESLGLGSKKISPDIVDFLAAYSWPGNVTGGVRAKFASVKRQYCQDWGSSLRDKKLKLP